jgi:predicted metal-binding membrane protein
MTIAWSLMLLLALIAWLLVVGQADDTDMGPGTMGLGLPLFLLLWVIMMIAMMFPSVSPVAITWVRAIGRQSSGRVRAARIAQFVGGYLIAWTAFGLFVYGALTVTGNLVDSHPEAGRWIGAGAFLLAGLHQLSPLKNMCLRHCRSPMGQLMHYAGYRSSVRDLRVGAHHGLYCVGCCWGLMILLIPLGTMNIAAMAGLAVVIFLEKLWRLGPVFSTTVGVVFLVLAALAPFQSWLLPGLEHSGPSMEPMT